jgi:hypothetical protein
VEIVVLIGARPYALPERSAIEVRDLIRTRARDDRPLGYLADAISEELQAERREAGLRPGLQ